MPLIEMQNIRKDYHLGDTIVHALQGDRPEESTRESSSPYGGLRARARRRFSI